MGIIRKLREWREKVDGTLTGPAIETDSATVNGTTTTDTLEAEDITIEQVGNFVRAETFYLPLWPDYISPDDWFTTTSGSGAAQIKDSKGIRVASGTTAGSVARITNGYQRNGLVKVSLAWDDDIEVRYQHRFNDYTEEAYVVQGLVKDGDKTTPHIGFAADSGELKGTVADGSTQNTVTLQTSPNIDNDLRFVHDSDNGEVTWFVNGTQEGLTTTNVPTGDIEADKQTWLVSNPDGVNVESLSAFAEVLYH